MGDSTPKTGVEIGRDCDDNDADIFYGGAHIEGPNACMKDVDNDGYGDSFVGAGVQPGSDCLDSDPYTHRAAAESESTTLLHA